MKHLIVLLVFFIGCTEQDLHKFAPTTEDKVVHIKYMKDTRTNLCFAISNVEQYPIGTADIFSNVPCTPEVEKLINNVP